MSSDFWFNVGVGFFFGGGLFLNISLIVKIKKKMLMRREVLKLHFGHLQINICQK